MNLHKIDLLNLETFFMKTLDKHNIPFILCVHSTDTNKLIKSQHPCIDIRQVQPKSNRKLKLYKDQKNQPRTWNGLFHMDQKVAKEPCHCG